MSGIFLSSFFFNFLQTSCHSEHSVTSVFSMVSNLADSRSSSLSNSLTPVSDASVPYDSMTNVFRASFLVMIQSPFFTFRYQYLIGKRKDQLFKLVLF